MPPPSPPFHPKLLEVGWTSLLLMYASISLDPWAHVWGPCVQWFGDLVACDYWGELWLNVGFATYFENYGAHVWGLCLQWFGDLVTCDYWGELWLNEGFATYFENYGATAARPDYRFFDTFYATQASLGQIVDAKNVSTHPLATITGV